MIADGDGDGSSSFVANRHRMKLPSYVIFIRPLIDIFLDEY